jgi:hypothetical protein
MDKQTLETIREKDRADAAVNGGGSLTDEQIAALAAERRDKRVADCTEEYNQAVTSILAKHRCRLRVGITTWNDGAIQPIVQIVAEG